MTARKRPPNSKVKAKLLPVMMALAYSFVSGCGVKVREDSNQSGAELGPQLSNPETEPVVRLPGRGAPSLLREAGVVESAHLHSAGHFGPMSVANADGVIEFRVRDTTAGVLGKVADDIAAAFNEAAGRNFIKLSFVGSGAPISILRAPEADGINSIQFASPFLDPLGKSPATLATAYWITETSEFRITESDILFNSETYSWIAEESSQASLSSRRQPAHVAVVLAHEIGHAIGLEHIASRFAPSAMHAYVDGFNRLDRPISDILSSYDRDIIAALYSSSGPVAEYAKGLKIRTADGVISMSEYVDRYQDTKAFYFSHLPEEMRGFHNPLGRMQSLDASCAPAPARGVFKR